MNILFLTQILPFPPDAGPKVKTWNVLRYLIENGHRVTLVSFVRKDEEKYVKDVQDLGVELHAVPMRRSKAKDGLFWIRSHFTGRPFLIERDDLPEMRHLIENLTSQRQFDLIHADQFNMAQFVPGKNAGLSGDKNFKSIFDAHNATFSIMERMQKNVPWFLKPVLALEVRRLKRYEAALIRDFDHTLTVTPQDKALLVKACLDEQIGDVEDRISVVPIAVDTHLLQPVKTSPGSRKIITLGTLHYPPNADGIRWFIQQVFPLIMAKLDNVTLTVVGKNPPVDFFALQEQAGGSIEVTGFIKDLDPYLAASAIMVVPVRAGSGMRVRILEAFARGLPMVTTTIGLEGIQASVGEDILVEDDEKGFAEAVIRLLEDPSLQAHLAENGRHFVENFYDLRIVLRELSEIYHEE